jgi:nucleoside-diphosphate-sugar epimerase
MLRSAAKETSVKRIVITSSFAALNQLGTDPYAEPPKKYDESVWNPVTWEQALEGPARMAYQASKKYAELAAHGITLSRHSNLSKISLRPRNPVSV